MAKLTATLTGSFVMTDIPSRWREIAIDRAQAAKLLADNRTDLLKGFISKAGNAFPAYLVMDDMGKVTFEFPPREAESAQSHAE